MNIFKLRIATLQLDASPAGKVVARETVSAQVEADAIVARARGKAARILCSARRARADARRQARERLVEAEIASIARANEAAVAAAHEAAAEALRWTVHADHIEETLARRVERQCRDLVRRVVVQFAGEADRGALIAARVAAELDRVKVHESLTIFVSTCDAEVVRHAVGAAPARGIAIQIDASLPPGSARLESPYLYIALDLDAHLRLLLDTLSAPPERS
ncbi:FliH/SctL family protein [Cupriavidus pampae]|uniref:Uncharacterized protein n=1 Tax=Cupriavidus pampae TaxID=659251 RepID=A0ABN7ZJF6_9BURK|nr:hypothetical protein [Cupriavidus pampae]CAG9185914.1 hypothetical protein LMG32289_06158 [Cupriavidus pampae]